MGKECPSRAGLARVGGNGRWPDGGSVADGRRQAGSGRARNRAKARLNWFPQGQPWGRCRVRRRAERVSRPARAKKRRRRVLVVVTCSPRPMRAVQRASNCVGCQERWAISAGHEPRHVELFLTMAFRMVSSLRMQATKLGFTQFKRRRQGNLQVGGTERPGVPECRGQRFGFGATVRNAGDGASTATTLRYYQSKDAPIRTHPTQK